MSEIIVRAAEAIYNSDFDGNPPQAFKDRDLDVIGTYLENARAVFEAIREPTPEMIASGVVELSEDGQPAEVTVARMWWEMIYSALGNPQQ